MPGAIRLNVKTVRGWMELREGQIDRCTHFRCPTCRVSVRCLYIDARVMTVQCRMCYQALGIQVEGDPLPTRAAIRKAKTRLKTLAPLSGVDLGPAPEG